jgi:hypothetical protein
MPKTPDELKEQVGRENAKPHSEDKDVTSEGMVVERPARDEFFGNLKKLSDDDGGDGDK